jgi:hypothetical protein
MWVINPSHRDIIIALNKDAYMTKKLLMGALAGLVTSFSVECIKAYVSLTKLEALVISIFIVVVVYKICELAVAKIQARNKALIK